MKKSIFFSSMVAILAILVIVILFFINNQKIHSQVSMSKARILYTLTGQISPRSNENNPPSDMFHLRSVSPDMPLRDIVGEIGNTDKKLFSINVDISSRTLFLEYEDRVLKEYRIGCGSKTNSGDKEKEGDYRTPKGEFYICSKEKYSPTKKYLGSRWMLLSYPGVEAAEKGLSEKLIDEKTYKSILNAISKKRIPPQNTPLGSAVGIHGGAESRYPKDWTAGCIGMYDKDVEEIFDYVSIGTKVVIK